MPALQVRNFPDELYSELRKKAEQEHRSVAQQTIVAIHTYLAGQHSQSEGPAFENETKLRSTKQQATLQKIRELPRFEVPDDFPSIAELIREDRDAR